MKAKFFLVLFFLLCVTFSFVSPVFAQNNTTSVAQNPEFSNLDSNVPANLHTYSQSVVIEVLSSLSCMLTGYDPAHPHTPCLGVDAQTGKLGYVQQNGGLVGMMGGALAMTFDIPVSTHDYVAYAASNFGFAKKTYAQSADNTSNSAGFLGISPLINIWRTFRNLTYVLFTIIFILIGVGIILRLPIDARAVMTVQNQLPRVIMTLILITLSFAIAGLLIDFMYVLIYAIYSIFASIPGMNVPSLNPTNTFGHTPFEAVNGILGLGQIAGGTSSVIGGLVGSVLSGTIGRLVAGVIVGIIGAQVGGAINPLGGVIGLAVGGLVGALAASKVIGLVGQLIAFVIIAMAMIIALVRLWLALIKAYIYILLDIIFAPLWIGAGAIPKSPMSFSSWLRHISSNLLVFPVTFALLMLAYVFINVFSTTGQSYYFVPPFVGNLGSYKTLGPVIAFGIILLTTEIPTIIKDVLKTPEVKYSAAIGRGISGSVSTTQGLVKPIWGRFWKVDDHGNAVGTLNSRLAESSRLKKVPILRFAMGLKKNSNPKEVTDQQTEGTNPHED